jgi:hypothetical protein
MQWQFCFSKLVCFSPWLAGRFHNFELTQNREKTRNGLMEQQLNKSNEISFPKKR